MIMVNGMIKIWAYGEYVQKKQHMVNTWLMEWIIVNMGVW